MAARGSAPKLRMQTQTLELSSMLKKQSFCLDHSHDETLFTISDSQPGYFNYAENPQPHTDQGWGQLYKEDTFILTCGDTTLRESCTSYSSQRNIIKFYFRLSRRKHTLVLNGFGEYDFDVPELFIVCGPDDMLKVDLVEKGVRDRSVALWVTQAFFTDFLGLNPDGLPEFLRNILTQRELPFCVYHLPLTPDLLFAANALLAVSSAGLQGRLYHQAKATELICLIIRRLKEDEKAPKHKRRLPYKRVKHLEDVREMLNLRYADSLTLDQIAREAGLSKTVLTSSFLDCFGLSVFDYIQQQRMSRAYELLQSREQTIAQISELVGFSHAGNFSKAFRVYFGVSPKDI